MAEKTISIDVVAYGGPLYNYVPVINKPSPVKNASVDAIQLKRLLQFPGLYIYEAGTQNIINAATYNNYFPSGGGSIVDTYTKEEINALLLEKVDAIEGMGLSSNDFTDELKERLENLVTGKVELVYDGTNITRSDTQEIVNFADILDLLVIDPRFTYLSYGNRAYLTCNIDDDGEGLKFITFTSPMVDSSLNKNAIVTIYSNNGTDIIGINATNVASENVNNKVSAITDANKTSTSSYPSNKAITDYIINTGVGKKTEKGGEIFNSATDAGSFAHAEGVSTVAAGFGSHAEGSDTIAVNLMAHAEGADSIAMGSMSHAEGSTFASGERAHAEGYNNNLKIYTSLVRYNSETNVFKHTIASKYYSSLNKFVGGYAHVKDSETNEYVFVKITEINTSTITLESDFLHGEAGSTSNYYYIYTGANGMYSHIEGLDTMTTPSGFGAHAEGYFTVASAQYAHAEGNYTTASGFQSHAEGSGTTASGGTSHAEGTGTTASGITSHAEGGGTIASGVQSHAEGNSTRAIGSNSHVEGYSSFTIGNASHAEGNGTRAIGNYSHAEGLGGVSTNVKLTKYSGKTFTYTGYIEEIKYRSGYAYVYDSTTSSYLYDKIMNIDEANHRITLDFDFLHGESGTQSCPLYTGANGEYSHTEGYYTIATGSYSHAEGGSTTASNDYTHAEGSGSKATGYASHAEGYYTTASGIYAHVEGNSSKASGQYSHSEGNFTTASGDQSHAEGNNTYATGGNSHSEGGGTNAYGAQSHAEGASTHAIGINSHSEGLNTFANGEESHVEGYNSGEYISMSITHMMGPLYSYATNSSIDSNKYKSGCIYVYDTNKTSYVYVPISSIDTTNKQIVLNGSFTNTSSSNISCTFYPGTGKYSHTEGNTSYASGETSHAEGSGSIASGNYSHAEGGGSKAIGGTSHAEGGGTTASGDNAHSEGGGTTASGPQAHAEGAGTTASGMASHAEGTGSRATGGYSHAEGGGTTATGSNAHSEGGGTNASGAQSHAEGGGTTAIGDDAHSEGTGSVASGAQSHAEGYGTTAIGVNSHVEGRGLSAIGAGSHAEGLNNSSSYHSFSISLTRYGSEQYKFTYETSADINRLYGAAVSLYNSSLSRNEYTTIKSIDTENKIITLDSDILHGSTAKTSLNGYIGANGTGSHTEGIDTIAIGIGAHSEGIQTIASGDQSHSEGHSTTASGPQSHAEGGGTTASGGQSHAEGGGTTASGSTSHAEGNGSRATGDYSHAEGTGSRATGYAAHAEGGGTNATGSNSHSEGGGTTASGGQSHAEGGGTTASGSNSHAEGDSTIASGDYSHAEGRYTIAASSNQHVQGKYNIEDADDKYAFIIGNGTASNGTTPEVRSNAMAVGWDGKIYINNAETGVDLNGMNTRLNTVVDTKQDAFVTYGNKETVFENITVNVVKDGENDWYISEENPFNITFDYNALYRIIYDGVEYFLYCEILQTIKGTGNYPWKIIGNVTALENTNYTPTDAPFCISQNYQKNGKIQLFCFNSVLASHTLSIYKTSFTRNIPVINLFTFRDGVVPLIRQGTGENSVIENSGSIASGNQSHAEGSATKAIGNVSHAENNQTTASGNYSHSEGTLTIASGSYSHAEGSQTEASGGIAHAEGQHTIASGNMSHAECNYTTASGNGSHAEGNRTTASELYSHAEGSYTTASGRVSHVQGQYNVEDTSAIEEWAEYGKNARKYIHIVGNGKSEETRSNAHTIDWLGNTWYQGELYLGGTGQEDTDAWKANLPKYSADDEGKVLKIVNGVPTWEETDITLTQAEYDALPEEQKKNNSYYFIKEV